MRLARLAGATLVCLTELLPKQHEFSVLLKAFLKVYQEIDLGQSLERVQNAVIDFLNAIEATVYL